MLRKIIGWLTPRKKCTFKHFDPVNGAEEFTCDDIRKHKNRWITQYIVKNCNSNSLEEDTALKEYVKQFNDALANCTCQKDE